MSACFAAAHVPKLHPQLPITLQWAQVNEAAEVIYDLVDSEANLIFGAVVDPALGQEVIQKFGNLHDAVQMCMFVGNGQNAADGKAGASLGCCSCPPASMTEGWIPTCIMQPRDHALLA